MPTADWWAKPKLFDWDGDLILFRMHMSCTLCWAACMDGADAATDPARRRELEAEAAEWRGACQVLEQLVRPPFRCQDKRAKRA